MLHCSWCAACCAAVQRACSLRISLSSAQRDHPSTDGARNAASVLAQVNCSVCAPWTSDEGWINCAAAAWQQGEQARATPKTTLGKRTYQSGPGCSATSPAHCAIALCRMQCSLSLTFCPFVSPAAKRVPLLGLGLQ